MSFVTYEQDGYVGVITINRPEALNALNVQVLKDLDAVIDNINLDETRAIAAVNGFALGGGNELAMSCDIRYCSDNAVFGQPEVGLGITPGFGGTQRLVRVVGTGKAKEMVFTGQNIKADEAYRIGLVNGVYPREELMPAVMKLAQKIASNAPIAVRNSKRAVTDGFLSDLDHAIAIEEQYFSECFETEDQREGMKAFLEKRKVEKFNNR